MDNDSWHNYPSVYALGHKAIDGILDGQIVIEEKIDGSQFSFGVFGGEIRCRSKGKVQDLDAPDQMFTAAMVTVRRLAPMLRDGWTYRGEYLRTPHHNALTYGRIPDSNIILFDINTGNEHYLSPDDKAIEAARIGLEMVPMVTMGDGADFSLDAFKEMLSRESCLGGTTVEGVVIKNYGKFTEEKKAMMGKFVSEDFKEVHKRTWAKPSRRDILTTIREQYRTPARWTKAVQHLEESGKLEGSPRDIGAIIIEAQNDVHAECADEIKDILFATFWPQIKKGLTGGLPEWYKQRLAARAFEETEA